MKNSDETDGMSEPASTGYGEGVVSEVINSLVCSLHRRSVAMAVVFAVIRADHCRVDHRHRRAPRGAARGFNGLDDFGPFERDHELFHFDDILRVGSVGR